MSSSRQNIVPIRKSVYFDLAAGLVKATQTLTSDATNPDAAGTITLGANVYTLVADLTAAVAATGVLTSDNTNVTAGKKVTVGSKIYTFVAALSATHPAHRVENEVLIGADADASLNNLISAINGVIADAGVKYSLGTTPHPDVTAGTVSAHAFTVTAKVAGTAGNAIAKAEDDAHLDWDGAGATLTGGIDTVPNEIKIGASAAVTLDNIKDAVNGTGDGETTGEGFTYSVGTVAHPTIEATTNTDTTQVFQARTGGVGGNSLASTEDATHLSFGATALAGGGGTVGKYVFAKGGGVAHRFLVTIPNLTGTPTVAISLYNANDELVKALAATAAESALSDTAYEVSVADGDYIKLTASATVSDVASPCVLEVR